MTEYGLPFDGKTLGDAVRAEYTASEWAEAWARLFGFPSRADWGPVAGFDNGSDFSLAVKATGTPSGNVEVRPGSAMVQGRLYSNDATVTLTVAPNASGNPRVDTVVLRKDDVLQTIRLAIKQGTPAASPVPPGLTQTPGVMWEIPIADIDVANGFSSIAQDKIRNRNTFVNAAPALYLDQVLNDSGGTLETGDVVVWKTTVNRAVTTTTSPNDFNIAGVWVGRTANGGYGRVLVRGIGYVRCQQAIAAYSVLTSGTVAKQAVSFDQLQISRNEIGVLLETSVAGALALAYVNVRQSRSLRRLLMREFAASGTDRGGFTSGAWQNRFTGLTISVIDYEVNTLGVTITTDVNGKFTLPAGVYRFYISLPAFAVDAHQGRLFNFTQSVTDTIGTSEDAPSGGSQTRSIIQGIMTSNGTDQFQIQHRCQTTKATDGMGRAAGFGEEEIYGIAEFFLEK